MTAHAVVLALPCTPLRVKVQIGSSGLTYLERVALRAIALAPDALVLSTLEDILPIGARPLYDLLFGLWRQGYIQMNIHSGKIKLARGVHLDMLDQLRGTATEVPVDIVQERLTGRFLPVTGSRSHWHWKYRLPVVTPFELRPEMRGDIVRAVAIAARRRQPGGVSAAAARAVPDIRIEPDALRIAGAQRWVRVRVDCVIDGATDQLRFLLLDQIGLDGIGRQAIERALDELAHDRPHESPFDTLREQARPRSARKPLSALIAGLYERSERLHAAERGVVAGLHDDLVAITREINGQLAVAARADAEIDLVIGREQHEQCVVRAIETSREQLLLCCPFIDFAALQRLQQPLRQAISRGVQVHLMWGIAMGNVLDESLTRLLDDIAGPRTLHRSRRSCRTHAKLVVSDCREALVTSFNFLSPSSAATLEVGVSVRSPSLCSELLRWAAENHTDYLASRSLTIAPAGGVPEAKEELPEVPELPGPAASDALAASSIRLWGEAWRRHAAAMAAALAKCERQVNLVSNARHVELLWHAVRSARQRLVIASDALRGDVFNDKLIAAFEERLASGDVEILCVYRRIEGRQDSAELVRQLAALTERHPRRFQAIRADTHCKLLVWDDHALASSFNFLSFSGFYGVGTGQQRLRERSELGLVIDDRRIADQLVERLGELLRPSLPLAFRPEPRGPAATATTGDLARVRELLEELREVKSAGVWRRRLGEHFRRSSTPWADLDLIVAAKLPPERERDAIYACLHALPADHDEESRDRFLRGRARALWERRMFWETAILIDALSGQPAAGLPSLELAVLAATWDDPEGCDARMNAFCDRSELAGPDRLGLALVAICELVRRGSQAAHRMIEVLVGLDPLLADAARPLIAWWTDHHGAPFPVDDLEGAEGAMRDEDEQQALLDALRASVDAALNVRHAFAVGTRTWARLVSPHGALGQLQLAIAGDRADRTAVARWLDVHPKMDALLDETARVVNGDGYAQIVGSRRRLSLTRLDDVRRAAARWVAARGDDGRPRGAPSSRSGDAARALFAFGRNEALWRVARADAIAAPLAHEAAGYLRLWGVMR